MDRIKSCPTLEGPPDGKIHVQQKNIYFPAFCLDEISSGADASSYISRRKLLPVKQMRMFSEAWKGKLFLLITLKVLPMKIQFHQQTFMGVELTRKWSLLPSRIMWWNSPSFLHFCCFKEIIFYSYFLSCV